MLRVSLLAIAGAILFMAPPPNVARSQSPSADIWGEAIMPQPFDAAPFREIKIPGWVEETVGCGYTLSVMDCAGAGRGGGARRDDQRDGIRRSVLRLLRQQAAEEAQPARAARPADQGHRRVQASWACGILGVYPPCLQGEVYENHPDWRRIATNTTEIPQIDMKKFPTAACSACWGPMATSSSTCWPRS